MGKEPSQKRKTLLINPAFQKSFLTYTVSIALNVSLLYYAANLFFFKKFYEKGELMGLPKNHVFFQFIDEQRVAMNWIFFTVATLSSLVILAYGLYLSNKIAGPIHQVKEYLKRYQSGTNAEPLQFRAKDYFPDLADAVTEFSKADSQK